MVLKSTITFFQEAWAEFRKVVWPTKKQLIQYSILVLVITFASAAYIGLLDGVFSWIYFKLISL